MSVLKKSLIVSCGLLLMISCHNKRADKSAARLQEEDFFDTSVKNQPPKPMLYIAESVDEADEVVVRVDAGDVDSDKHTYMYDWDGNGTFDKISSSSTVKHRWTVHGKHKIRVRVQDGHGALGDTSATITVKDRGPNANFSVRGESLEGVWVAFDARKSSTPNDPIIKYEWDWDYDGKTFRPSGAEGQRVENRWMKSDNYLVALRVTDADGSTSLFSKLMIVEDQAPLVEITGPKQLLVGEVGSFSGLGSRSVVDAIVGYFWDTQFDGVFVRRHQKSKPTVTMKWDAPGSYRVALKVSDADGSSTVAVHRIKVVAPPPKPEVKTGKKKG